MMKRILIGWPIALLLFTGDLALARTDFQVRAADGSIVIARTMEFALDLKSDIYIFPREQNFSSRSQDGKIGLTWTSKYGFIGINALGNKDAILDGINEGGLAVEALWFPESQYPEAIDENFLVSTDLVKWMLGNFVSAREVRQALLKTRVIGQYLPELKQVPGMHVAVHDADGNNLVIEFIGGEQKIYDNPIGVMTNRPTFDWHLTNLRNYVNLSSADHPGQIIAGARIEPTGSGTGWIGLPGDWTPPTRFIRAVKLVHSIPPVASAAEAITLAEHILNAVDIPWGAIKTEQLPGIITYDYTQWALVKDLGNRILYYRSYYDLDLKKIDLKKLNLKPGAPARSIPIEGRRDRIRDVTDQLL